MVLGIAIGWGLYGNTSSPLSFTTDPGAKSDGIPAKVLTPPRQLHSLGGLTGLFEQMRTKFGDTNGYDLTIYPDYASLERPDPTEPPARASLLLPRRMGRSDRDQHGHRRPARRPGEVRHPDARRRHAEARRRHSASSADEVKTLYINIEPNGDMTAPPDSIEISIYVSPQFGNSGYIVMNGDGSIKHVNYPSS